MNSFFSAIRIVGKVQSGEKRVRNLDFYTTGNRKKKEGDEKEGVWNVKEKKKDKRKGKKIGPQDTHEDTENQKDSVTDNDIMDNPYLRPAKLQRKRRK
ncbi:hypothetical protein HNY73_022397 [Argiope bruennichi]|uniref:Uncharacterized protein n=1 Tax=Argiope bruennichi TaxID=94029 RepID=A0A8T0E0Q7_ARGBR|nr:hypothetical protein HNY73_022397 [Argiope bruennichi]